MSNMENEQMYLDMVNQLKEKYDDIDKEVKRFKKNDLEQKKIIWSCYGILRIIDITFHADPDFNHILIQNLRGMLSEVFDEWYELEED